MSVTLSADDYSQMSNDYNALSRQYRDEKAEVKKLKEEMTDYDSEEELVSKREFYFPHEIQQTNALNEPYGICQNLNDVDTLIKYYEDKKSLLEIENKKLKEEFYELKEEADKIEFIVRNEPPYDIFDKCLHVWYDDEDEDEDVVEEVQDHCNK